MREPVTDGQAIPPPCVIVLGMHRSGTSLVAGSLEAAGLYLGEVNNAATYNRKGNKENESIRDLNDRLLARAGAAWNTPPTGQVAWSPADEEYARSLVKPYLESRRPWGFKDPRSIWTVEGWLRIVPNARPLGVFRHPSHVVRSLGARRGALFVAVEEALRLWCSYNRELLRLNERYRFPMLHIDTKCGAFGDFSANLMSFGMSLGLTGDFKGFFSKELLHHTQADPVGSDEAGKIYALLMATPHRRAA